MLVEDFNDELSITKLLCKNDSFGPNGYSKGFFCVHKISGELFSRKIISITFWG
jgi:hypothetical protein